jgi:hypothetical protein
MSDSRYSCPKCGKTMTRDGKRNGQGGAQRYRCQTAGVFCYTTTNPEAAQRDSQGSRGPRPLRFFRPLGELGETKRYIVTSAQNATPVHEGFMGALLVACRHLNAELIVIPLRYKNPTSRWSASQENDESWAEEVQPYLYNQRKKLNPNLVLLGDVKTQPTASSPLTGFEGLTHGESSIIGHTKLQLEVVPVPAGKFPKIMTTTGACTVPNYTDSKAGKLGEFHHILGAVMVEVIGKTFHLRQLLADKDGSFTDCAQGLLQIYSADGVRKAPRAKALVMGDKHVRFTSDKVRRATFGEGGMVDVLDPETLVWHDVHDGYAVNPHHDNVFTNMAKQQSGYGDVRAEVEQTVKYLDRYTTGRNSVVVSSNHDNFLSRWVNREDWKRVGPDNAMFYLETATAMLSTVRMGKYGAEFEDPFRYWVARLSKNKNVRCLKPDESFAPAGIECGMHGDSGPNGARGTIKNLSRLGSRVVVGHSHTPGIREGAYQVGTSTELRAEYTEGPSSWLNAHCVIYANGKRSLLFIIDGEWRLQDREKKAGVAA